MCICIVAFSTSFFDVSGHAGFGILQKSSESAPFQPCYFEAIVTVNLTTMLVLTSLFIGVSNSQPITAYPKMIDIWYVSLNFRPHE